MRHCYLAKLIWGNLIIKPESEAKDRCGGCLSKKEFLLKKQNVELDTNNAVENEKAKKAWEEYEKSKKELESSWGEIIRHLAGPLFGIVGLLALQKCASKLPDKATQYIYSSICFLFICENFINLLVETPKNSVLSKIFAPLNKKVSNLDGNRAWKQLKKRYSILENYPALAYIPIATVYSGIGLSYYHILYTTTG